MAQSQTDLCNSALQRVGAATILNINDNSREARACAVAYDSVRKAELRKRKWLFAKKRATLAASTTAPGFEFAYAFPLPADCLRVLLPKDNPQLDWVVESRQILTNQQVSPWLGTNTQPAVTGAALFLNYIADIQDATLWDPTFYDLASIALALRICEPISNSNQKKVGLQADYKEAMAVAAAAQAFETLPQDPPEDGWLIARVA